MLPCFRERLELCLEMLCDGVVVGWTVAFDFHPKHSSSLDIHDFAAGLIGAELEEVRNGVEPGARQGVLEGVEGVEEAGLDDGVRLCTAGERRVSKATIERFDPQHSREKAIGNTNCYLCGSHLLRARQQPG